MEKYLSPTGKVVSVLVISIIEKAFLGVGHVYGMHIGMLIVHQCVKLTVPHRHWRQKTALQ